MILTKFIEKLGKTISVEDLPEESHKIVKVKCDIPECGKEKDLVYRKYTKNTNNFTRPYTCSIECANKLGKSKQTKFDKYGDENFNNMEKNKQTKLENHGDENYNNRKQAEETCIETYGVENPMQNSEIIAKSKKNSYKLKEYTLPSGKIVKVQGCENFALDILFKEGYNEKDLFINDKDIENHIGQIWYIGKDNRNHRYVPDIYIISENKIIEVKSTWTYVCKKDSIFLKRQKCIDMGMNFDFMVFGRIELLTEQEVKQLIVT